METIKKIAVAVDFSDTSLNALKMAFDFAKQVNAILDIVHCAPISAMALPEDGQVKVNQKVLDRELSKARSKLDSLIGRYTDNVDRFEHHVIWGEPTLELNKYVSVNHLDMIIIGTHGRSGIEHLLMGSVAESVLRHADVPVICVRKK